ncbi:hypothetical protein BJV82DRAFT_636171 [Fennellomyces sp. T-0311]|nr:hypothetical protein BJV82DRAFT_636171 [Fennellomyces sp. T-0311]
MFSTPFTRSVIFVSVILSVISSAQAATVMARSAAGCVYMAPSIYCYGGRLYHRDASGILALSTSIFNSLDLSTNASVSTLQASWTLINNNAGPNFCFAMAAVPDHKVILMDGGAGIDDGLSLHSPYNTTTYSIETTRWKTDIPDGHLNILYHTATLGPDSNVYIFGGRYFPESERPADPVLHPLDMYQFNVQTSQWSTLTGVSSLSQHRSEHKSVLAKDGKSIYHIGGIYPDTPMYANLTRYNYASAPMNQILVFDTANQQWSTQDLTGLIPSTRCGHSLTLKPNTGEIILFGGYDPLDWATYREDYFYLLDTETMSWSNRTLGTGPGATYTVTTVFDHSAVLVGNNLFIMFGIVPSASSSDIRVLDTNIWSWISFVTGVESPAEPTPTSPSESSSDSGGSSNAGIIAGAVVGSVAGVAIIGAIVFFLLRKRRQEKNGQRDHGSNTAMLQNNDMSQGYNVQSPHAGFNTQPGYNTPPNQAGVLMASYASRDHQGYQVTGSASPDAYYSRESSTQVSNSHNNDTMHQGSAYFYGTEKPDGASRNDDGVQRLVLAPVKPDGA